MAGAQWALGGPAPAFAGLGLARGGRGAAVFASGALGISQVLWIMSVERLGIGLSALHINAAPFYVMLILFALGQPWDWVAGRGRPRSWCLGVLVAQGILPLPFGGRR